MANNYLITGYWGEPHVTAENDRGINAAIFGTGRFVLPVGEQFKAEYIGNNTIRMYDGKLMNNGAAAGIPAGEYIDLLISNAGQGMQRNDLIVFQYQQDASTLVEKGTFIVVQGTETDGTASDPVLTQADLLTNKASFDQMALWRVPVSGTTISAPEQVFSVYKTRTLLWSNDSTDEIGTMSIPVNNADYDGFEIIYTSGVSGGVTHSGIRSTGFIPADAWAVSLQWVEQGLGIYERWVYINNGSFATSGCSELTWYDLVESKGANTTLDNSRCIPRRIYGIRGVR